MPTDERVYPEGWVEEIAGEPWRFRVKSRTSKRTYLVDLEEYGWNGRCDCALFRFNFQPSLVVGKYPRKTEALLSHRGSHGIQPQNQKRAHGARLLRSPQRAGGSKMRALSFWQPHGSLLVTGAKKFETRGRMTKVRGEFLIHAAQRLFADKPGFTRWVNNHPDYFGGLLPLIGYELQEECYGTETEVRDIVDAIAYGAFIGIGELAGCHATELMTEGQRKRARQFGDFSPGRFAWEVVNVRRFARPIPAKGRQGFWFASIPPTTCIRVTDAAGTIVERFK